MPLFFGQEFLNPYLITPTCVAFILFSLSASAVYIFNDLEDVAFDRMHPEKRNRPVASGSVSMSEAYTWFSSLALLSVLIGMVWNVALGTVLLGYLLLNVLYTKWLKKIVILDICCIALGFLLRLQAGAVVTGISLSYWIIGLTFLLSIFLALGKRRDDVLAYTTDGQLFRKTAQKYNLPLIDNLIKITSSSMIVGYISYTLSPDIIKQMGSPYLFMTALWVIVGLGRYLYLIFRKNQGGSPTKILVTDIWLQLTILAWIVNLFILIY